jgi:hypothetical protein
MSDTPEATVTTEPREKQTPTDSRPPINWRALDYPDEIRDLLHRLYSPSDHRSAAPYSDGAMDRCEAKGDQLAVCVRMGCARRVSDGHHVCTISLMSVPHGDPGVIVPLDVDEDTIVRVCSKRRLRWRAASPVKLDTPAETFATTRSKKARYKARLVFDWLEGAMSTVSHIDGIVGAAARAYLTDDWSEVDAWTGFTTTERLGFTELRNARRIEAQRRLFVALSDKARSDKPWNHEKKES